jgi:DNA-binding NarL/FixJ family response regulator/signal transduction histidine kinase
LDVLLAAALLALDVPRVWTTYPGDQTIVWEPSVFAVVLVVAQTAPIALRRVYPIPVLMITLAAVAVHGSVDGQPEPDYLSVCVAVYTVAAAVPQEVSRWCCGAAAVLLPAALAQDLTFLGIFRAFLLLVLVWALGLERRRAIVDRAHAAAERVRQDARERAIRAAQQDLRNREQIARSLHDGLARSLTLMTVHGEAMKADTGADVAQRIDALLRSGREALAAVQGAVAALDRGLPDDRPASWERMLSEFRDSGLIVDVNEELTCIPLNDDHGRCVYRVVHEGITNALRHAGPGARVTVRVTRRSDGTTVVVTNDDGGAGVGAGRGVAVGGFGLISVDHDVRALSGVLEYGPEEAGWRLMARLPRQAAGEGATPTAPATGDPILVVVVDDEAMIRDGLRMLLGRHSDMAVVADFADGGELLSFLGLDPASTGLPSTRPDAWRSRLPAGSGGRLVVLLDLAMPGVDGFAVLAAIRAMPPPDRPLVLVLTTYGADTSVRRALDMGAHGFLLKGGTAHQLAQAVRAVAGGLTALSPNSAGQGGITPAARPAGQLTPREQEVFELLGEGLSNRAIAQRLGLSERTVKIHVSGVLAKLGVQSRTQAALQARGRS